MKASLLAIALFFSSVPLPAADDIRSVWLRGDWKRAEAQLNRAEARARHRGDASAELSAMRDRVLFLLDRNSYSRFDPQATRVAVERLYEMASKSSDPAMKADAIHAMGRHRYWQMFSGEGDWKSVAELFERARAMREESGLTGALADSHFYLGLVSLRTESPRFSWREKTRRYGESH